MSADPPGCGAMPSDPPHGRAARLEDLLAHPLLWRAGHAARQPVWSSGFARLDEALPGGGWPRSGLIEVLPVRFGVGELKLLLPALAALTTRPEARWSAWVAPPLSPFTPALVAAGIDLSRLLIVRAQGKECLWALEQALGSGACDSGLAWARHALPRQIRRLHLAAQRGRTLGVLFRPRASAREASAAMLRLVVEPLERGVRVTLLKSRGGARGALDLTWGGTYPGARGCP